MIIKLLLNIMGTIITIIINIVNTMLPSNGLGNSLSDIITILLTICQQGLNFMYLIFGETFFIIMTFLPGYLAIKFVGVPIIQIIRGFFINSTE